MASEIERAWHVFALNPNALNWRTYETHLQAFNVDGRIAAMKSIGEWPPRVDLRERWHDFGQLLDAIGDHNDYLLTLHDSRLAIDARPPTRSLR